MFCALNGATRTPCRASQRQIPAVMTDLPASDVVPATSSEPLVVGTVPLLPEPSAGTRRRVLRCARVAQQRNDSRRRGYRNPQPLLATSAQARTGSYKRVALASDSHLSLRSEEFVRDSGALSARPCQLRGAVHGH